MSEHALPSQRSGRGRRPAAEVRSSVLAAAADLLFAEGLRALTFERVAAKAGASKVTLYKWWPSPEVLAFEAYFEASKATLEFVDTGDIIADLRTQLRAFIAMLMDCTPGNCTRGHIIAELVGAAQTDDQLATAFRDLYSLPRRELAIRALRLAQLRGQLPAEKDPSVLVDQLWGACYFRLMHFGEPLDAEYADTLIDNLFR